jgi:hypothetical protein
MEMKKTLKIMALAGISQLISWTHLHGQFGLESLPEGFPKDGITYNGDNSFTSAAFGSFRLDTSIKNRVVHDILGPLIWSYENDTKIVVLSTEWFGKLLTTLPTEKSSLGFEWPYLKSDYTGAVYIINLSGDTNKPFFNTNKLPDGTDVGWQSAIGLELTNAQGFYLQTEARFVHMQQILQTIRLLRDELAQMGVLPGSDNIDQKRSQAIAELAKLNSVYGHFLFYANRTVLAAGFVARNGGTEEEVAAANQWGAAIAGLSEGAAALMQSAQAVIANEIDGANGIFNKKLAERAAAEAAKKAAEDAAKNKPTPPPPPSPKPSPKPSPTPTPTPTPTPNPGGGSSNNAGTEWESAIIMGPVAKDVMSWKKSITLHNVSFSASPVGGRISVLFPCSKSTAWKTVNLNPGGRASYSDGNWWLIQNVGGRYYATTMDYFRPGQFRNDWAPNVFWEHLSNGRSFGSKSTPEVAPMVYRKGETYGLMVSTLARQSWRTTNERSNIILFTMP